MMLTLKKGQKVDLTKGNSELSKLNVKLKWQADPGVELDTSAFLLGDNGKVASDNDFVFYGNPSHASQSISIQDSHINIDLPKVPASVSKIAITLTIYSNHKFAQVRDTSITVNDILNFGFGDNLSVETAIVVAEIYRHKGEWKFNAVGAGFKGGLEALCNNFGVDVDNSNASSPPSTPSPSKSEPASKIDVKHPSRQPIKLDPPGAKPVISSSSPPTPPLPSLSLKKLELKKGQKINLVKTGATLGEIIINLNWSQTQRPKHSGGFLSRIFGGDSSNDGIDLDLACLFELQDGTKGVVQALGEAFGSLHNPPYIALDGDDRTGSSIAGETIRVNGKFADKIKRILVFTFIYDGVANWREVDGVVTVKCPGSPDIIVKMDEYGSDLPNCGIALLTNTGGTFSVEKIVKFYKSTRYLDQDFGWGLRWVSGRK